MNDDRPIRYELRIKNRILWEAIHAVATSVAALCRQHSCLSRQGQVGELLALQASPYVRKRRQLEPRPVALWLVQATGRPFEELFPADLYDRRFPKLVVAYGDVDSAIPLLDLPPEQRLLASPEDEIIERVDLERRINAEDDPRAADILRRCAQGELLHEIGEAHHITQERVRQIRNRSIRNIRSHPFRTRRRARAAPADLT